MTLHFARVKLKELEKLCRSQGIPLTVQRRIILENLASRTDHPTADQIYDEVSETLNGVSRTTVYRVLDAFVRLGMVVRVSNPKAKARFDADTSRHHHMICLSCDAVIDCRDDGSSQVDLPVAIPAGFQIRDFSLSITGLCAGCNDRQH